MQHLQRMPAEETLGSIDGVIVLQRRVADRVEQRRACRWARSPPSAALGCLHSDRACAVCCGRVCAARLGGVVTLRLEHAVVQRLEFDPLQTRVEQPEGEDRRWFRARKPAFP